MIQERAQEALYHGPGRFRALYTFDPKETGSPGRARLVKAAATLLKELEGDSLREKPLEILVAVSFGLLAEHEARKALEPEHVDGFPWRDQAALLVQVAAETEDERTYAGRLIRRVLGDSAQLRQQFHGGRHTLNREPFGYREAPPLQTAAAPSPPPRVPTSGASPGVAWLLYQQCEQKLDAFYALPQDEQDAVIGLKRDADPAGSYRPLPGSHVAVARGVSGSGPRASLLRRSFGYETYDKAGLLFLATAQNSGELRQALDGLDKDRLKTYFDLGDGGLYVVPPSSAWLCTDPLVALGEDRPQAEAVFFPRFPLVLYEMTPKTLAFFHRVFHAHKDHFDEGGKLREDLKLLTKGLAKILYGGSIQRGSSLYDFLRRIFDADCSARVVDEIEGQPDAETSDSSQTRSFEQQLESLSGLRLAHEIAIRDASHKSGSAEAILALNAKFELEAKAQRDSLRPILTEPGRVQRALDNADWARRPAAELFAEMVMADAETMSGRDPAELKDLDTLIQLCEQAADEAREINDSVGYYMTFMC